MHHITFWSLFALLHLVLDQCIMTTNKKKSKNNKKNKIAALEVKVEAESEQKRNVYQLLEELFEV